MPHLKLDHTLVDEASALAQHIVKPVIDYIGKHTTVAIERATLRLIGVDGVDQDGVPLPNRVVERALPLLSGGILRPFVAAMLHNKLDAQKTAEAIGRSEIPLQEVNTTYERWALLFIDRQIQQLAKQGVERICSRRTERAAMIEELGNPQP